MTPQYVYRARLIRVLDGDTAELDIDLGFRVHARLLIRLRDVNCPEARDHGGPEATAYALQLLTDADLLVQTYKDQQSFARWVADVWIVGEGAPLAVADALVAAGHAVRVDR